jgi:hypothetical protein
MSAAQANKVTHKDKKHAKKSMLERFFNAATESATTNEHVIASLTGVHVMIIIVLIVLVIAIIYHVRKPKVAAAVAGAAGAAGAAAVPGAAADVPAAFKYFTSSTSPGFDLTYTP